MISFEYRVQVPTAVSRGFRLPKNHLTGVSATTPWLPEFT